MSEHYGVLRISSIKRFTHSVGSTNQGIRGGGGICDLVSIGKCKETSFCISIIYVMKVYSMNGDTSWCVSKLLVVSSIIHVGLQGSKVKYSNKYKSSYSEVSLLLN